MNWNDNEGPWGPSKGDKSGKKDNPSGSPWGRQGRGNGGPPNNVTPPPDIEEALQRIKEMMGPLKPNGHVHAILLGLAALIGLWLLSGIYMVGTNQMGVVMRFGAMNRTELPGLHYHMPTPIEDVLLPIVTSQNEIQIGFRNISRRNNSATQSIPEESLMLTQDENIIDVQFTVFWRIADVANYLFEIRDPDVTIKMAAESVMREVIGQNKLQFALTKGRGQIAEDARARLQDMMNEYKAGIMVSQINLQTVAAPEEVKDAFQDVVNARLDMERFQNQAAAHVNKVIPDAKGQAAKLVQQAMAYRDQKIAISKGEAERFTEVLAAYNKSRNVTRKRLYLETMEAILSGADKVITGKTSGTVPLYPLHDLKKKNKE
ncbi:MAG TPA: FtsH protease activity modulator HflK [Rhodospirillaceae bacterium]|nr:FtsH protease activity modulator HflK [Rhodospirillaceae bacterium]